MVWSANAPAEVVDAEGRRVGVSGRGLISAPPSRCRIDGGASSEWTEVRAWAGPWCIDERWWDALAHRRRARLQVVLGPVEQGLVEQGARTSPRGHPSEGSAHLLTLEDGRWWVEATYD
jgi:protein ImuB